MKTKSIKLGDRFWRWTILQKAPHSWAKWIARCDCGIEKIVQSSHLFSGQSKSCGCLRDELAKERAKQHGDSGSPEYRTWKRMRRRCDNPADKNYASYGGRGIVVCERWRVSFTAFLSDMGRKPTPKNSIERRDNEKGYSPDNCYWASAKQQSENRRSSRHVILAAEKITMTEAARRLQLHYSSIQHHAKVRDITLQEAIDHYASRGGF